jgi:hypothetical protein
MNYCDIVKQSPSGREKGMWASVDRISNYLEKMKENHPHEVKRFLKEEYIAMNGKHLNESVARKLVSDMHHSNGEKAIRGEMISPEDAASKFGKKEEWYWDAYAAANAMMHDLANTDLSNSQILDVANKFFFEDEDFSDENKVFWYFEWLLF